jgi:hypothetical protein
MPTNLTYEDANEGAADEVDVTEAVMEMLERDNGASLTENGDRVGVVLIRLDSVCIVVKAAAVCRSVVLAAFLVGGREPDVAICPGE